MIIIIIQISLFVLWIFFSIYFFIELRKKTKILSEVYNVTCKMECNFCHYTRDYTYNEYLKIIRKPRKEKAQTAGFPIGKIERRIEYRFLCESCNTKQYHKILYDSIQHDDEYVKIRNGNIVTFFIKIFALGIFMVVVFVILEKI